MGFRKAGKLRISKSGRALEFAHDRASFTEYFYAPLSSVKELLDGKRANVEVSLLVADSRIDEKFDA